MGLDAIISSDSISVCHFTLQLFFLKMKKMISAVQSSNLMYNSMSNRGPNIHGLEDESKDYICQKISRVGKKNIDRKKIRR